VTDGRTGGRSGSGQGTLPGTPAPSRSLEAGWEFEKRAWADGCAVVAGSDEVGRGALAGPVVAAMVVFPPGCALTGLRDSKLLSAARREGLAAEIRDAAQAFGFGDIEAAEVDRLDVLQASLKAMRLALASLPAPPDLLLLDAVRLRGVSIPQRRLLGGDRLSATIAAASILAKVRRDERMVELDRTYPYYGFGENKGYGTAAHLQALKQLGPSPVHRRTFRHVGSHQEESPQLPLV
jgi:ribonuclease HII